MKDVGESGDRNNKFKATFNRDSIIQSCVKDDQPIIFDIGAHEGQSIEYLENIFSNPIIYSFEPDPSTFKTLNKKASDKNKIFNLAFSNKDGDNIFYKNKISHTNSLFKVNINSIDSIRAQKEKNAFKKEINEEIRVKTSTLDSFFKQNDIDYVDLMKIDTQGAEELVLEGGQRSLHKINNIILEVSLFDYYTHKTNFSSIEKYLLPAGFELFSILEISNNPMNGRTDWVEALYKKTS